MAEPAFQNRDGVASMRELARKVCILVNTFGSIIERQYPDNADLQAALGWARAACTIVPSFDAMLQEDPAADPSPADPALWPGVNPDRHPMPDLPEDE